MKHPLRYLFTGTFLITFLIVGLAQDTIPLSYRNANYDISAKLDVSKKMVDGQMKLTWRNISQDTLRELQFHLYLNAFKNSKSTFMTELGGTFNIDNSGKDVQSWGYIDILDIRMKEGENLTEKIEYIQPDDGNKYDQTAIRIPLSDSIFPGETVEILCTFKSKLPKILARTGFSKDYFFVGQWFPKIAVYEQAGMRYAKKGAWNCHQFHAMSEFYADFGIYNVNITVPKDYIVGSTGVMIDENITGNEKTMKFQANDVIDFAWTASPKYKDLRDDWENVQIRLLLQPEHVNQSARHFKAIKEALNYFKEHLGEYPYPIITVIDPPFGGIGSGGMEYPTLITVGTFAYLPENIKYPEFVAVHEFGHQYFMGILASNEFEEAWMDEGMNSYFETRIMDAVYGNKTSIIDFGGFRLGDAEWQRSSYVHSTGRNTAESYRYAWEYPHGGYSTMSYQKPATFLNTLHQLIGDECMDDIMKTYYQRWKFKHPCSQDFIDVVNEVIVEHHQQKFGTDLNWYFKQVLYDNEICDYKLALIINRKIPENQGLFDLDGKKVSADKMLADSAKKYESKVVVKREGNVIMPVELLIRFEDGQVITKTYDGKDRTHEFKFYTNSRIISAQIDPENKILIDVNLANNSKQLEPNTNPVWKYTVKFLFWIQNLIQTAVWFV